MSKIAGIKKRILKIIISLIYISNSQRFLFFLYFFRIQKKNNNNKKKSINGHKEMFKPRSKLRMIL